MIEPTTNGILTRPQYALAFFDRDAVTVAQELLGALLLVRGVGGCVVETEAYCSTDPASHSFRGVTKRNAAMFGTPGSSYVYLSYGIHWCLNVVCRSGDAVLFRAMEPRSGLKEMVARRGLSLNRLLCSGPGRLGQALAIGPQDNARQFSAPDFCLAPVDLERPNIVSGPRIGISRGTQHFWRFGVEGSPYLSKAF